MNLLINPVSIFTAAGFADPTLSALEPVAGEVVAGEKMEPPVFVRKFPKPQWGLAGFWRRRPPSQKKETPDHENLAQEFLKTGAIDTRNAQRLEAHILAKADDMQSGKKWNADALLDLSVLAEALADHVAVNRADRILLKMAQTLQIYFSVVGWKGTKIDKQLIQEPLAFLKEGASAAFASGNFERSFRISLALFHQAQEFLNWAKRAEDPDIQREGLEARLWVKLFLAKVARHPKMEEADIRLEVEAFLTCFNVDARNLTYSLRKLAYEKEKNALPSTDRLMAEAYLKLAEEDLFERNSLGAVSRFCDLASLQAGRPDSFSPCEIAMSWLRIAEHVPPVDEWELPNPDFVKALQEASAALQRFDAKKRRPFTDDPVVLAPWQTDCLRHAWLDLRLTILARPQGLKMDFPEIRGLLSNLSDQMKRAAVLAGKLEAIVAEPGLALQYRRFDKVATLFFRLKYWIEEGKALLASF